MKYLMKYEIPFKGLKEGKHEFEFQLDNKFFEQFENSEVTVGQLDAMVTLTRQSTMLILDMTVRGEVELMCDRCLGNYSQELENTSRLIVKFGVEAEELSDEIVVIEQDDHQFNVAYYLYELVILGLPAKHVHPLDENGESTCDPEMIKKLNMYLLDDEVDDESKNDEPEIDERWSELKKLLDNK
ncbi:MAG: DUF177 domain-containing protein [Prolixibacteraceae bacterium]|nr:DUF177 domain-containing protein [Prolixibacteraceae bacterium]MBN2650487.1 DUF177 domain-containing protein [Prolixibacteraceae bacterium]